MTRTNGAQRRSVWFTAVAVLGMTGLLVQPAQAQTCDDLSGVWAVDLELPGTGRSRVMVTLDQDGCSVTGGVEGRNTTSVEDGTVDGSTVTFIASGINEGTGERIAMTWEATVSGDEIEGTLSSDMAGTFPFTGSRADNDPS